MDFKNKIKKFNLKWIDYEEIKKGRKIVPEIEGVYLFKFYKEIDTISGEKTDIIYIGQSFNLGHRLIQNYLEGRGGKTTQRIHNNLIKRKYVSKIKVSWHPTQNRKQLESKLLKDFENIYHQLPCWNRSG